MRAVLTLYLVYYVSWHCTAFVDVLLVWWISFCQKLVCCNLYCTARPSESVPMDGMSNP